MTRAQGTDISAWQDVNSTPQQINFIKMAQNGAKFSLIRASQLSWIDEDFGYNWKMAREAGLYRGAYHYLDWRGNEIDQAKLFVGALGRDLGELPPCLDFEMNPVDAGGNYLYGLSHATIVSKVKNFLSYIMSATNRIPMIYTGYYFWRSYGSPDPYFAQFPFWLAWWASEDYIKAKTNGGTGAPLPWTDWKFWQYTNKGDGLAYGCESLQVDLDVYNGTAEELAKFAHQPEPVQNICRCCGQVIKAVPV